jgi:hypothetical protein
MGQSLLMELLGKIPVAASVLIVCLIGLGVAGPIQLRQDPAKSSSAGANDA